MQWLAASFVLVLSSTSAAQSQAHDASNRLRSLWAFEKIIDSGTAIPNTPWHFTAFRPPAVSASGVVFTGVTPSYQYNDVGIYRVSQGVLQVVADFHTTFSGPWPNATHDLFDGHPASDGEAVAFLSFSQDAGSPGLSYWTPSSGVTTIINKNTAVPGGTSNFVGSCLIRCAMRDGKIAFNAYQMNFGINGVFLWEAGALQRVADASTPIPNGTGNFSGFAPGSKTIQVLGASTVAFMGTGAAQQSGIYFGSVGSLARLVDQAAAVPAGGGTPPIGALRAHDSDGSLTAFITFNQTYRVYSTRGLELRTVVLEGVRIPETIYSFTYFSNIAVDGGRIAINGGSNQFVTGVYEYTQGCLYKVLQTNDPLDGKVVQSVTMRDGAFRDGRIGMFVQFTNGSSAVFVAHCL